MRRYGVLVLNKVVPRARNSSFWLFETALINRRYDRRDRVLKTNSTLTTLNLGMNSIGDNGGLALAETLKINSTLTTLDLESNSIEDNGAQVLSDALKTNSTLTALKLPNNSIGDNGALALSQVLKDQLRSDYIL
ncbi:hypothetical protein BG000_005814 [Podila horticola]|nr:hypothetical protein BG000_005814 [Podila horticola]